MEGTANCDTYDLIHLARGGNQAAKDQLVRDNMGLDLLHRAEICKPRL